MAGTFFISDLHLQENQPKVFDTFSNFLLHQVRGADALYILGDLFEVWIGDDDLTPFNLKILELIKQTTHSGLPVFFMHGNRDFLIGKKFAAFTGITILPDPSLINLYGMRTLLMHGDSLCTFDTQHQKIRQIMHNRFYQWLALKTPLNWRRSVSQWGRKKSRRHISETSSYIMDVNEKTVIEKIQEYQAQLLIHGHTHKPGFHNPLPQAERIVLGAWHHQGNALFVDKNNKELLNFDVQT